ncbi:hypothetical protein [uncultured Sphingomonas sp.]|uniref:hypothetical protein n=1 Tax=uncultured Sphingomonas sp. TaxID=158754 RepID=UPI0037480343
MNHAADSTAASARATPHSRAAVLVIALRGSRYSRLGGEAAARDRTARPQIGARFIIVIRFASPSPAAR